MSRPAAACAAFTVHFVLGALCGAAVGLPIWAASMSHDSAAAGLRIVGGGALLGGLVAGFLQFGLWTPLQWLFRFLDRNKRLF
jgi:presenilin-like A22 family membrane protease